MSGRGKCKDTLLTLQAASRSRALATRPAVLLLDEPVAGLGAEDTRRVGALLRAIADCGVVVLLVEHDMALVMDVSAHVVVMDAGRHNPNYDAEIRCVPSCADPAHPARYPVTTSGERLRRQFVRTQAY